MVYPNFFDFEQLKTLKTLPEEKGSAE